MKHSNKKILTFITVSLLLLTTGCSQSPEVVNITTNSTTVTTINTEAEAPKETTSVTTVQTTAPITTAEATTVITTVPVTETQPVTQQAETEEAPIITTTTTTEAPPAVTTTTTTAAPAPVENGDYKYEQSLKIAKELANLVIENAGAEKSLKQIACSAQVVYYNYYRYCTYSQTDKDDLTAYGVFIAYKASCQGAADALGMVLDVLGYKWDHINKDLYTHQWCNVYFDYNQKVEMNDGETKNIKGTVVSADASVPLEAYIGIGGTYGEDALLFSYFDFLSEDETGVLHETSHMVVF